ncbi:MAG: hypothetical protein CM15mP58_16000 [Burkholderiaceae bacterium]|nr:MAG: hypothetical protein CM15mP58_16000 [Burkholderiaceae bacterium]
MQKVDGKLKIHSGSFWERFEDIEAVDLTIIEDGSKLLGIVLCPHRNPPRV